MAKLATELKDIHLRRLKHAVNASGKAVVARHSVGKPKGLHFVVQPTGSKSWIFRKSIGGSRRDIGLGAYPDVSLKQAQVKADAIMALIDQGIDPVLKKKSKKSKLAAQRAEEITFSELAEDFINDIAIPSWKTLKQVKRLQTYLKEYVNPHIGNILIKDLQRPHLIKMMKPLYNGTTTQRKKIPTALRMINYVEKIIALGIVQGLRPTGDNPALWKGNLALAFPKNTHKVQHQRSVDWQLMPEFMLKLQSMDKQRLPGIQEEIPCLIFQILTVARPSESRLADWSEIDLQQKVWFIPNSDAELRKSDKEWMVPLCKEAIKILKAQGPKKKGRIFNNQGDEIPDAYVSAIPDAIGYDGVAHGFRSTFETWEQETQDKNWSTDAVRLAMKHTEGDKVRAAYARGQCYAERIRLMAAYEKWLYKGETKANVIPIRKRKSG